MKSFIISLILSSLLFGQSLTARDWLDYRGASQGESHFENRTWMSLDFGDFSAGILFWAQEPPRYSEISSSDSSRAYISQYWFSFYSEMLELTAGSFTQTLGQGVILDLFEREDIQIDHHCDGANFLLRLPYIEITGFNGIAGWDENAIVRGGEITLSPWKISSGIEYAKVIPNEPNYPQEVFGAFGGIDFDFLSFYGEYGYKKPLGGLEKEGKALYLSGALMFGLFSLMGEYKDYDEFAVRNTQARYNNPPTLIKEPYYTLPGRHYHELNPKDETGYAFTFNGQFSSNLSSEFFYGYANNHDGTNAFNQFWGELEFLNDDETFTAKGALEYKIDGDETYITPIADIMWEPDWTLLAFNLIAEFQNEEDFKNIAGTFSISYSPYMTLGVEGGKIEDENFARGFADVDVIKKTKIRLGYGKRPGGFTCSGGVCRYEEAFKGVEAQIIITF